MTERSALVLGATGLVGKAVLDLLLADPTWDRVVVLARKPATVQHGQLQWHLVDFDNPTTWKMATAVTDVFNCMGTTIKQAGTREAFRRVDLELPLTILEHARHNGASHATIISAVGASARSRVFYNRVKGELEDALRELDFPSLHILRPSLLVGDRPQTRAGEKTAEVLMRVAAPLMVGKLRAWRSVAANDVARAAVGLARTPSRGVRVVASDEIPPLAM